MWQLLADTATNNVGIALALTILFAPVLYLIVKKARFTRLWLGPTEPWSSLLVLLLASGAAAVAIVQVNPFSKELPKRAWVLCFLAAGALTLLGLAWRFSLRSLRVGAVLLLAFGLLAVFGLGRAQIERERRAALDQSVAHDRAQLAELSRARLVGAAAVDAVRTTIVQARSAATALSANDPVRRNLLAITSRLETALTDGSASQGRLASIDADIASAKTAALAENQSDQLKTAVAAISTAATNVEGLSRTGGDATINDAANQLAQYVAAKGSGDLSTLTTAAASAHAAVAAAEADLQPSDDTARAARTTAEALLTAESASVESSTVGEVLSAGGRALIQRSESSIPIVPQPIGWLLAFGLVLLTYLQVERYAAERGALLLAKVDRTDKLKEPADAKEKFRTYVSRNVPEPSAVPGSSSTLKAMTTLLSTSPGNDPVTWLGKIVSGFLNAISPDRGAVASFAILSPGTGTPADLTNPPTPAPALAPAADATLAGTNGQATTSIKPTLAQVAVRVSTDRRAAQIQRTFSEPTLDAALRAAGYWAAAIVLESSPRVPPWTVWDPEASSELATYYEREDSKAQDLVPAVFRAPMSGLLLVQLASQYLEEGNARASFAACLQAASQYPRWPLARYRLSGAAEMLAKDDAAAWRDPVNDPETQSICDALRRSKLDGAESLCSSLRSGSGSAQRIALCDFAVTVIPKSVVSVPTTLGGLLRMSERAFWSSLLQSQRNGVTARQRLVQLLRSGRVIARNRKRQIAPDTSSWERLAESVESPWQVAYNMACAFAEAAAHSPAPQVEELTTQSIVMLERAIADQQISQLTKKWMSADPDLDVLKDNDRFKALLALLPDPKTKS